jgi:predicted thioredoxin/glutaredoxin
MVRGQVVQLDNHAIKKEIDSSVEDLILFVVDSEIQKNYLDLMKSWQTIPGKKVISYVSISGENAKKLW